MMSITLSGVGTSRGLSFLKALLFVQHVFEVPALAVITLNACQKQVRSVDWRGHLPFALVRLLEKTVEKQEAGAQERLMAGLILICVCTRGRWSEATDQIYGSLELSVSSVKTLKAELRGWARLALTAPALGVAQGVAGLHWANTWLRLRRSLQCPLQNGAPLLPTSLADGGWGNRAVRPGEGTAWIRSFAARCCEETELRNFRTADQARNCPNFPLWRKRKVPKIIFVEEGYLEDAAASAGKQEGESSPPVLLPVLQCMGKTQNRSEEPAGNGGPTMESTCSVYRRALRDQDHWEHR